MIALSKCARSNSHLVQISSEALARSRPNDSCTPACFWTGSIWPKPDTARTKSDPGWFWTICQDHLWKNAVESDNGKLVAGQLHSARTGPSDSCTPACFQTRSVWPKADQAIQIRSMLVLYNMIQAFLESMELNQMQEGRSGICSLAHLWLHAGHNDHNGRNWT